MSGLQNCHNSKDIFSIPDFPLKTIFVLAPFTNEQILTFIKKLIKLSVRTMHSI